ncbi:MAG: 2-nitropropane dioxygenase, partial [Bradymonadaceae bacterium]
MPRTGDRQESTSAVGENDGSHSRGVFAPVEIAEAAADVRRPVRIVRHRTSGRVGIEVGGIGPADPSVDPADGLERVGSLPPLYPEWLGDRTFNAVHGIRFPYIAGAMANGISSQQFVVEAARADILGVFGAAGLDLDQIERGLASIDRQLDRDEDAWAANIIRSPHGSDFESELVDRLLDRGVETATASGFVEVTRPVVRYACSGLHTDGEGRIRRSNRLIAKVSRAEVARRFAAPASGDLLDDLVDSGDLTRREASLAREVPLAEDITAEADSGGHTD